MTREVRILHRRMLPALALMAVLIFLAAMLSRPPRPLNAPDAFPAGVPR